MAKRYFYLLCLMLLFYGCSKKDSGDPAPTPPPPPAPPALTLTAVKVNGVSAGSAYYGINTTPVIKVSFSSPVNRSLINKGPQLHHNLYVPLLYHSPPAATLVNRGLVWASAR